MLHYQKRKIGTVFFVMNVWNLCFLHGFDMFLPCPCFQGKKSPEKNLELFICICEVNMVIRCPYVPVLAAFGAGLLILQKGKLFRPWIERVVWKMRMLIQKEGWWGCFFSDSFLELVCEYLRGSNSLATQQTYVVDKAVFFCARPMCSLDSPLQFVQSGPCHLCRTSVQGEHTKG